MEIIRINNTQGDLVFALFDQYRVFYKQPSNIDLARRFIQARLDNNESVIFAALLDDGETCAGFTQLYPKYSSAKAVRNWILNDLYVDTPYRKQGIGTRLITAAIAFAKTYGAGFVELSTATDNVTAQRLYEHIGFERQAPEVDFITYRIPTIQCR
jgi:Acetyltransferases